MQSAFFRAVCQTGIFMICAQTITHFRPDSSYEKYLKLLVSVMVLIQIFRPISALFTMGEDWELENRIRKIGEQLDLGMGQAAEEAARAEQILERMTLMEVQELLEGQDAVWEESTSGTAGGIEGQGSASGTAGGMEGRESTSGTAGGIKGQGSASGVTGGAGGQKNTFGTAGGIEGQGSASGTAAGTEGQGSASGPAAGMEGQRNVSGAAAVLEEQKSTSEATAAKEGAGDEMRQEWEKAETKIPRDTEATEYREGQTAAEAGSRLPQDAGDARIESPIIDKVEKVEKIKVGQ